MDVDRKQVALAIKTYRLRHGMTQEDLGKRWGCSRWSILRVENAKAVSWETAYKMFAKLSKDLADEAREEVQR